MSIIRIGVAGFIGENSSPFTKDLICGAKQAVNDYKKFEKSIEIIWGNDYATSSGGYEIARKMIKEQVVGVVGHFSSAAAVCASYEYAKNKMIHITPAATITEFNKNLSTSLFRLTGRNDRIGKFCINYFINYQIQGNLHVIHDGTLFGFDFAYSVLLNWKQAELPVHHRCRNNPLHFQEINNIPEDSIVVFGGSYFKTIQFIKKFRNKNITWCIGDDCLTKHFLAEVQQLNETIYIFSASCPSSTGTFTNSTYSAIQILIEAIKKCNSSNPETISNCIHQHTWNTKIGKVEFDKNGDWVTPPYRLWKVESKQFVSIL